ncbi:hypothetical protein [Streptomyces sp. NPDC127033]|uniref:hypothetical protein n=1 Tax=Streptomyces sp. NPDC127033 TaxID=3347110 RepID=UPI0036619A31
MDVQTAVGNYANAIKHCKNLETVHRAAGNGGRGRRDAETSVNRGSIVMTVAAWQAFVQDLATALRDATFTEVGDDSDQPLLAAAMKQWRSDFDSAMGRFSTPDADQTISLLSRAGFNPRPSWSWQQQGGQGSGPVQVEPQHVADVIGMWLRVRHDVAHGHATVHALPILTAVRDPKASAKLKADPTLRLTDAIDCRNFFTSVVRVTAEAAAQYVGQPSPQWEEPSRLRLGLHPSQARKPPKA